ncbi:PREDICTED: dnaJ homolog subfamily C member 12 isoform X2 [Chinchilla lanigera]|nr:PREDICTED: dnaJ homolog subfamily C member 12 isoform X2 [Chinchilla lanigera]
MEAVPCLRAANERRCSITGLGRLLPVVRGRSRAGSSARRARVCCGLRDPVLSAGTPLRFLRKATGLPLRMDAILNYRADDSEDYYALLGCDERSSVEQILAEFRIRALECHPDKHPEDPNAAGKDTVSKRGTQGAQQYEETGSGAREVKEGGLWHGQPAYQRGPRRPHCKGGACGDLCRRTATRTWCKSFPRGTTFQKLQRAKEVLSGAESRARYDLWRSSQVAMPFRQWEALAGVRASMHWAVRGKKDLMLEEAGQTQTKEIRNEGCSEREETREEELGSATERMEPRESASVEKSVLPQNPDSPGFSDVNSWRFRFRWSGDAPSELLRKFRNYEI